MVNPESVREDLLEAPALQLRQRAGFDDANTVANGGFTLLVMHVVLLRALDDLVELRVRDAGDVLDDDRLVHFGGDDNADAGLAQVRTGVLGSGFAHGDLRLGVALGGERGENASRLAAHGTDAGRVLKLTGRLLQG